MQGHMDHVCVLWRQSLPPWPSFPHPHAVDTNSSLPLPWSISAAQKAKRCVSPCLSCQMESLMVVLELEVLYPNQGMPERWAVPQTRGHSCPQC